MHYRLTCTKIKVMCAYNALLSNVAAYIEHIVDHSVIKYEGCLLQISFTDYEFHIDQCELYHELPESFHENDNELIDKCVGGWEIICEDDQENGFLMIFGKIGINRIFHNI